MDTASDAEKDAFLTAASEAVLTAVVERIDERLSEDKREEFHRLFEDNEPDEEKAAFFKEYIPDFGEIVLEEATRFNRDAVAQAAGARPIDGVSQPV
jgi:hypothetical protein